MPIIWSEYNASYKNEPDVTDAVFMAPWLANTIRECDGLADMFSYWTFSDVFEEQGVVKQPFYGGFGLIAEDDLPKPAFNAFKLLHKLGDQRIPVDSNSALVTKRGDGALVIAVWNLFPPDEAGHPKAITINFKDSKTNRRLRVYRVDSTHGSLLSAYEAMGTPVSPTPKQVAELRRAAELPAPEEGTLSGGKVTVALSPQGPALLEIQ
jgi:xylan 1,4-beta-xylosidase